MKNAVSTLIIVLFFSGMLLDKPGVVQAFPALPASFYGTVKLNNANLPDGTRIEALLNNQVFAYTLTLTYQSESVYSLDIPGDDPATDVVDGGLDGVVVSFKVGGIVATQSGVWHSGINVKLNLTAISTNTPFPPQPSLTPLPTQTQITVYPTLVLPTKTPVTVHPTHIQPTQTSFSTIQPTTGQISSTTPAATENHEKLLDLGTPQQTELTTDESSSQTKEGTQISVPGIDPSQSVDFTNTKPSTRQGESDADQITGSKLILWIGVPVFVIGLLLVGFWNVLKRK